MSGFAIQHSVPKAWKNTGWPASYVEIGPKDGKLEISRTPNLEKVVSEHASKMLLLFVLLEFTTSARYGETGHEGFDAMKTHEFVSLNKATRLTSLHADQLKHVKVSAVYGIVPPVKPQVSEGFTSGKAEVHQWAVTCNRKEFVRLTDLAVKNGLRIERLLNDPNEEV